MRLFPRLRRSVALWICPEISAAMRSDERQMRELRMAAGYNGQSKPIARAKADAEALAFREARRDWLFSEKAIQHKEGLQDAADDQHAYSKRYGRSIRGIFTPTPEEREEFRSSLRESRVERAKQVLQIGREIHLHGFVGDPDLALNPLAERLADALFGRVGE